MTEARPVPLVPLDRLQPADWNPRSIDEPEFNALLRSIRADPSFLWGRPVYARATGEVYAGNQRLRAVTVLGADWRIANLGGDGVPAILEDVDERTARERERRDNNHAGADVAEAVRATHQRILALAGDPAATGISEDRIARVMASAPRQPHDPPADVDIAAELAEKWQTAAGDVWEIPSRSMPKARHRIAQGDATSAADLARLMGGARASMIWTDPPYGVGYTGGTGLEIANDTPEGLLGLLTAAFGNVNGAAIESAPFYVAHPAGRLSLTFGEAILGVGWRLHQTLVWIKPQAVVGHSDYHFAHETLFYGQTPKHRRGAADAYADGHESIYYGWTAGTTTPARGRPGSRWYGGDAQTTVLTVDRPMRSALHPTMKPIDLVARCIGNSSRVGEIVLDPFCGSGTTVLAAEASARLGYGLELDPRYLAATLERCEQAGLTPARAS